MIHETLPGDAHDRITYNHTDRLGSVVVKTNRNGHAFAHTTYSPFGEHGDGPYSIPVGAPFGYTGRQHDLETGLYSYRARYYSPRLGQFLSRDPVGPFDDPNLYMYVLNDPVNKTDPTGMCESRYTCELDSKQRRHPTPEQTKKVLPIQLKVISAVLSAIPHPAAKLTAAATRNAADVTPAAGSQGKPDFVVTSKGEAIPVPNGASGPLPTRSPGDQYTGGSGGKGMDSRTSGVRVMDRNSNQGRRAVYMNEKGQTVDPSTGRIVANSDPRAHHYLDD